MAQQHEDDRSIFDNTIRPQALQLESLEKASGLIHLFSPPVEILTRACFDWFLTDSNSLLAALSEAPYYNEEVLPPVIQELERYEICPGGDVTLVAENEFLKVKIVVSSLVLSLASDVFKALFGPNFKEGQGLGYTNPDSRTVPLGEDDPNALLLFCQVLHNRASEHDLDNVHHEEIVELATLVDKYNCGEAFLAHAYKFLAAPLVEDDSIVARSPVQADSYRVANLAVAAYLFNNPRFFLKYTRMLVLDRPMGWKTDTHPIADYLPATSLAELDNQIYLARKVLSDCITELLDRAYVDKVERDRPRPSIPPSGTSNVELHEIMESLSAAKLWPISRQKEFTITELCEKLLKIYVRDIEDHCAPHCPNNRGIAFTKLGLESIVARVKAEHLGLCLDSVRAVAFGTDGDGKLGENCRLSPCPGCYGPASLPEFRACELEWGCYWRPQAIPPSPTLLGDPWG